jgi:hypothetical protein
VLEQIREALLDNDYLHFKMVTSGKINIYYLFVYACLLFHYC